MSNSTPENSGLEFYVPKKFRKRGVAQAASGSAVKVDRNEVVGNQETPKRPSAIARHHGHVLANNLTPPPSPSSTTISQSSAQVLQGRPIPPLLTPLDFLPYDVNQFFVPPSDDGLVRNQANMVYSAYQASIAARAGLAISPVGFNSVPSPAVNPFLTTILTPPPQHFFNPIQGAFCEPCTRASGVTSYCPVYGVNPVPDYNNYANYGYAPLGIPNPVHHVDDYHSDDLSTIAEDEEVLDVLN